MDLNYFLKFVFYLALVPILFFGISTIFYYFITFLYKPFDWTEEADKLNEKTFLTGGIHVKFEVSEKIPHKVELNTFKTLKDTDKDFSFFYKWIKNDELIFIHKFTPSSLWVDFFISPHMHSLADLNTKNHVVFKNDTAFITARYIKGNIMHQWQVYLILVFAITPIFLIEDLFSLNTFFLGIIFVPIYGFFLLSPFLGIKCKIIRGLRLILTNQSTDCTT